MWKVRINKMQVFQSRSRKFFRFHDWPTSGKLRARARFEQKPIAAMEMKGDHGRSYETFPSANKVTTREVPVIDVFLRGIVARRLPK